MYFILLPAVLFKLNIMDAQDVYDRFNYLLLYFSKTIIENQSMKEILILIVNYLSLKYMNNLYHNTHTECLSVL